MAFVALYLLINAITSYSPCVVLRDKMWTGLADRVEMIIAGRFCGGVGLGLTLSITPVYLVEVTSLAWRGMLGVLPPVATQLGLLLTYLLGCWLDWRMLSLAATVPVSLFLVAVWLIPEEKHNKH